MQALSVPVHSLAPLISPTYWSIKMKRLNPATGVPFKKGDIRENGDVFYQYRKITKNWTKGYYVELWLKPELFKKHNFTDRSGNNRTIKNVALNLLKGAQGRCRGCPSRTASGRPPTNGKVTITKQWILDRLEKGICEATGDQLTIEPRQSNTASLDRIDSNNPDYTPENCRIVTWQFNNMRGAYSDEEFIRVAKQLEKIKKRSTTPLPTINSGKSQNNSKHRASTLPRFGEDSDDANDYRGATQGENSYRSAKEGSGDSMGHGGKEMGAPTTPEDSQDTGDTGSTVNSAEEFFERVLSKSRELDLVVGATRGAIQQSDHRRVESLQRSFNEKIQSLEETLKELREAHYSDRNTDTTRDG